MQLKPRPNHCHTASMLKQRSTVVAKKWQQYQTSFALKFRPFDKVEHCLYVVAKNGNVVDATGNKVVSCIGNVASTLLLEWTGLNTVMASCCLGCCSVEDRHSSTLFCW